MAEQIKVWDPLVRLFHWSLVAAFTVAYTLEDAIMALHAFAGYTVLTLVLVRVVWGFIGTRYARFSNFVRGPRAVWDYMRSLASGRPRHFVGHNPAGGAMIVALLLALLATTLSGLALYGVEGSGLLAGWFPGIGHNGEEMLEETHEFFANFTLLLVMVHVAGVAVGSLLHRENLVRAMVTGRKNIR